MDDSSKVLISLALFGAASTARLDNLYLPSNSRQEIAAATQYAAPSLEYLPASESRQNNVRAQYNAPDTTPIRESFNQATRPVDKSLQFITSRKQYPTESRQNVLKSSIPDRQYLTPSQTGSSSAFSDKYTSDQYSQPSYRQTPIVNQDNIPNNGDGRYSYAYETADGTAVQERSNACVEGRFSYTSPEGQQVSLKYTADEFGFHPQGSSLATPPPISQNIQRPFQQKFIEKNSPEGQSSEQVYNSVSSETNQDGYRY